MQILLGIIAILAIIGIMIGFPFSIFLVFKAKEEQDETKKRHIKKQAKWSFLGPILLLILDMVIFSILGAIQAASQK